MEHYMYDELCKREKDDWWFVGRRKIILNSLEKFLRIKKNLKILDIGCGAGGMVDLLSNYGDAQGIDTDRYIVKFNCQKGRKVHYGSLDKLHFDNNSLDLITLLEVLEHVDDDENGLKEIYRVLKPNGFFFISVPAFPFLWSSHDFASHHKRRYTKKELVTKLKKSGFSLVNISYFDSFLFPIILTYRFWTNLVDKKSRKSNFFDFPLIINTLLKVIFSSEAILLKNFNFPLGVSILAVVKKTNKRIH